MLRARARAPSLGLAVAEPFYSHCLPYLNLYGFVSEVCCPPANPVTVLWRILYPIQPYCRPSTMSFRNNSELLWLFALPPSPEGPLGFLQSVSAGGMSPLPGASVLLPCRLVPVPWPGPGWPVPGGARAALTDGPNQARGHYLAGRPMAMSPMSPVKCALLASCTYARRFSPSWGFHRAYQSPLLALSAFASAALAAFACARQSPARGPLRRRRTMRTVPPMKNWVGSSVRVASHYSLATPLP